MTLESPVQPVPEAHAEERAEPAGEHHEVGDEHKKKRRRRKRSGDKAAVATQVTGDSVSENFGQEVPKEQSAVEQQLTAENQPGKSKPARKKNRAPVAEEPTVPIADVAVPEAAERKTRKPRKPAVSEPPAVTTEGETLPQPAAEPVRKNGRKKKEPAGEGVAQ